MAVKEFEELRRKAWKNDRTIDNNDIIYPQDLLTQPTRKELWQSVLDATDATKQQALADKWRVLKVNNARLLAPTLTTPTGPIRAEEDKQPKRPRDERARKALKIEQEYI